MCLKKDRPLKNPDERQRELESNLQKLKLPSQVQLIVVTKTFPASDIECLINLGKKDFGENYVQELQEKAELIPQANWHFIGHLQSNKLKTLLKIPNLVSIQSLDSRKLLDMLMDQTPKAGPGFYLQVSPLQEATKGGFQSISAVHEACAQIAQSNLAKGRFLGFMGIAPENSSAKFFKEVVAWRDAMKGDFGNISPWKLSLGMSGDYQEAIQQGTDCVRIGSLILGRR